MSTLTTTAVPPLGFSQAPDIGTGEPSGVWDGPAIETPKFCLDSAWTVEDGLTFGLFERPGVRGSETLTAADLRLIQGAITQAIAMAEQIEPTLTGPFSFKEIA